MKITKFLTPAQIKIEFSAQDKPGALEALVKILVEKGHIASASVTGIVNALMERESLTSTGLGYGVALPHIKTDLVNQIYLAFARCTSGIDFDSLDGAPVNFFFLILAPTKSTDEYLKILSSISALMKDAKIRSALYAAQSADEIFHILDKNL